MTATETEVPVTARALLDALTGHYRKPGEARSGEILITEPQAPKSQRRCDLLRIGMWSSRGTGIDVHEIKVSRSDWLRELDDPAKAEAWWPYCSRFWVVAPPGIVAGGELPEGWGLMEPQARSRRFKVRVRPAEKQPELTVGLIVELMRRADNQRLSEMDELRQQHRDGMWQQEQRLRAERSAAAVDPATRERLELLERVETAIGVPLDRHAWKYERELRRMSPGELAEALAGAADHVRVQRLAARTSAARDQLLKAAATTVAQLEGDTL